MSERLLLNMLLILAPVFGYQLMMLHGRFQRDSKVAQYIMGSLSGISSVLCMSFPIVTGPHFLWDMRWTAFLLAVMYGRLRGGVICAVILLGYRAMLGGFVAWLMSMADAVALFPIAFLAGQRVQHHRKIRQVFTSILPAALSYIVVEITIFLYFVSKHQSATFLGQGTLFFIVYGIVSVSTFVFSVVLIENLMAQMNMRQELQESEKLNLIADLASSFAHEIRNPLTVAKGFVQFIGESLDTDRKHYTELVTTELDRAESIISDYLNLAKPQNKDLQVIALEDILVSLIQIMSPFATMNNAKLTCQVEPELYIYADVQHFKQLVMNIVKNAVEALQNDGHVQLHGYTGQGEVVITVSDNGVGMTEEQIGRLGRPFYSTKSKGTGLGLMVTHRLVDEMNGTLHFESEPGVGTTVRMLFPKVSTQIPQREIVPHTSQI